MSIHNYYNQLSTEARGIVADAYRELSAALRLHTLEIVGDDAAERVVEAIAKGIIETNNRQKCSSPFMTPEEARNDFEWPRVQPGDKRRFYSSLRGFDGAGILVRQYSGQEVTVVDYEPRNKAEFDDWQKTVAAGVPEDEQPEPVELLFLVRAPTGLEFHAWECELNGFFFATGQWYGPW